jgi:hypothetical protein
MEVEILSIRRRPWWKFWKVDNWEVKVRVDGKVKQVSIFADEPILEPLFIEYVVCKAVYGTQWIHKVRAKAKLKESESRVQKLVGQKFDAEKILARLK